MHAFRRSAGPALRLTLVLVVALAVAGVIPIGSASARYEVGSSATEASLQQAPGSQYTLRVYGDNSEGAGDFDVRDPVTGLVPEDPPYTDARAVFDPQLEQAPRKDSITWNPLWMSQEESFDENQAQGLYEDIRYPNDGAEKVWFRMWYEPEHLDKDINANGELDPGVDEWYPAIMQEFTYLLTEKDIAANKPEPVFGQAGRTQFVFPVGMREADLFDAGGEIDTNSIDAQYGYGLTSLDGDFDGVSDIVYVESELTLFDETDIAADFNGNGFIDPLDTDGVELSGDELAVLRLQSKRIEVGQSLQFLDHLVRITDIFGNSVRVEVWNTGGLVPKLIGGRTLGVGDMALAGTLGPVQLIEGVENGGPGTNLCDFPTGPWFVYVDNIDLSSGEEGARLIVGRALGAPYSAMEDADRSLDDRPGDPWFLKRFYVDGHEYNTVAIKTRGAGPVYEDACDLDDDNDGVIDVPPPSQDPSRFQFITIRTPIPKVPVTIDQHSVQLQPYDVEDRLSVMPPFNYEHYILKDVQAIDAFDTRLQDVDFIGHAVGPVAPILQNEDLFPYTSGVGPNSPYADPREMFLFYVEEDVNPQYLGELREKYGDFFPTSTVEEEFWYVEQWWTRPWQYTEFVLPDIRPTITGADNPDLYLLTSAFFAPQGKYRWWIQDEDVPLDDVDGGRVKFWFDPAEGGKKYKNDEGIRIYGRGNEGAGDPTALDPVATSTARVEVPPYTDPWAPFNPQLPQAPVKDSLTFDPAYMNEFEHGFEPLSDLYGQISVEEADAREKVFFRMWYEPEYLDKARYTNPDRRNEDYIFPALLQEFTYMLLDTADLPTHGQPGTSRFAFPMATGPEELPVPVPGDPPDLPDNLLPSFGYGITTFDANFDDIPDPVVVHSETSLAGLTGIQADFDGDGVLDFLDEDVVELNGNELVVLAVEDVPLRRGQESMNAQFLDYMATLDRVTETDTRRSAELQLWYTGGGLHLPSASIHPDLIETVSLDVGEMVILDKQLGPTIIPAGGDNLGEVAGGWFVYLQDVNRLNDTAIVIMGRALGATHSAIDDGQGEHDLAPGDPWYLKRFFVDGHEYNVVAVKTVPADEQNQGDEPYEFKYITIRTPVPKVNFINNQDSQKLQGYFIGEEHGENTSFISVMPPFNVEHTEIRDVQRLDEENFANPDYYDQACLIDDEEEDLVVGVPALDIEIIDEDQEPQFFGELKEILWDDNDRWSTEQYHIFPDRYTDLALPEGRLYMLTSDWESPQSRLHFFACDEDLRDPDPQSALNTINSDIPAPNVTGDDLAEGLNPYFDAAVSDPLQRVRVKFWYDPNDPDDIYINPRPIALAIDVVKTADPTSLPEPGGDVEFTVRVINSGSVEAELEALDDDIYGDLDGQGTCSLPQTLAVGASYECMFIASVTGDPGDTQTDTVTARATDAQNNVFEASDDATVTITDAQPQVRIEKTADPGTVLAPGGDVEFTVQIENLGPEPLELTALVDNVYGDLDGEGTCNVPQTIAAGGFYECTFTGAVSGVAGETKTDTVTATLSDDDGNEIDVSDSAIVNIVAGPSLTLAVNKLASPSSRPEPGGNFTFTVEVENTNAFAVTLTSLVDDVYGDLDGQGSCAVPQPINAGNTYSCSFSATVTGNGGDSETNTVTATIEDNGNDAQASDSATVNITNVLPDFSVTKTATATALAEPGGDVTFSVEVFNNSTVEAITLEALADDVYGDLDGQGTCNVPQVIASASSYTCSFDATVSGNGGEVHSNTVTATGTDDEGPSVDETDTWTIDIVQVPPNVTLTKDADPEFVQPGNDVDFTVQVVNNTGEPVTITDLSDTVYGDLFGTGRCTEPVGPVVSYQCTFTETVGGTPGEVHENTASVTAQDDEGDTDTATDTATVTLITSNQTTCDVSGTVLLQGRQRLANYGGTSVWAIPAGGPGVPAASTLTADDGSFTFHNLEEGSYIYIAKRHAYLRAKEKPVQCVGGQTHQLQDAWLAGGDVDDSGKISIIDLVLMGLQYNLTESDPGWDVAKHVDVNENGAVNIFDLVVGAINFREEEFTPWNEDFDPLAATDALSPGYQPTANATSAASEVDAERFDVRVDNMHGLYGIDLTVTFDTSKVTLLDADAESPGIQIELGGVFEGRTYMPPLTDVSVDEETGLGTLTFATTLIRPSEPIVGDGVVLSILYEDADSGNGTGAFSIDRVEIGDQYGHRIQVDVAGNLIRQMWGLFVPFITR